MSLVLNFADALVVKEQVASTSQQATLAATATLYESIGETTKASAPSMGADAF